MVWVVVTPARDETERLPLLGASLAAQRPGLVGLWVVVDDGSTDATSEVAASLAMPFEVLVLRRNNSGGLAGASELDAFVAGADAGLGRVPDATRIMKCDADIQLTPEYLARLDGIDADVGVCAGTILGAGEREQRTYTLGALKAYSPQAYALVREMPRTLGWDVADEVRLRLAGLGALVDLQAIATTNRRTGSSEGLLEGRRRNGQLSRWLGYHPVYFALRFLRFLFRKPYLLGAGALLRGYLTAGPSPYDETIRAAFRAEQVAKLRALARNPVGWLRSTYSAS